jgi:hypothetical protein
MCGLLSVPAFMCGLPFSAWFHVRIAGGEWVLMDTNDYKKGRLLVTIHRLSFSYAYHELLTSGSCEGGRVEWLMGYYDRRRAPISLHLREKK